VKDTLAIRVLREELNIAQRGLISVQRQIPKGLASWKREYLRDGKPCEVRCQAPQEFGVPHGLDNDVYLALQEEFMVQGCPDDGGVRMSLYRLIQMCGMDDSGDTRRDLRVSLDRLRSSTFWLKEQWHGPKGSRALTVTFTLLSDLAYSSEDTEPGEARLFVAVLPPAIANSIREGYVKPVSALLLRQLRQPARAAYRILDALRQPPGLLEKRLSRLSLNLMELADHFGLSSDRPEIIRRSLDSIHQELLGVGYLAKVELRGRGKQQSVDYTFGTLAQDADPRLTALLIEAGLPRGAAEKLSLEVPENIERGLTLAKEVLSGDYRHRVRSKAALMVDIIRTAHTDKYAAGAQMASMPSMDKGSEKANEKASGKAARRTSPPRLEGSESLASDPQQSEPQELAVLEFLLGLPRRDLSGLPPERLLELKREALGQSGPVRREIAARVTRELGNSSGVRGEPEEGDSGSSEAKTQV